MAVATPVLERNPNTDEENSYGSAYIMSEDERHNSKISENYARLINPEVSMTAWRGTEEKAPEAETAEISRAPEYVAPESRYVPEPAAPAPYRVESARTTSDLFRADSAVNSKLFKSAEKAEAQSEEEENEDLRPTKTTIQYKTQGVGRTHEEGRVSNSVNTNRRATLTRKEKIIIAVVVSVIVALFVLVIVNSAIISNINSDMGTLQSSLSDAKTAFKQANDRLDDLNENLYDSVMDYVAENGGVAN